MTCKCKECEEYNTLKAILKRASDFIRWKELITILVIIISCYIIFGLVGLPIAMMFHWLSGINGGGAIAGLYKQEIKIKHTERNDCLAGKHTFCKII